jgi:hypothetical protein
MYDPKERLSVRCIFALFNYLGGIMTLVNGSLTFVMHCQSRMRPKSGG